MSMQKDGGLKESTIRPPVTRKEVFLKDGSKITAQPPKPKHRQKRGSNNDSEKDLEHDGEYAKLVARLKDEGLQVGDKLGSGSYSLVMKATKITSAMGKPKPVAVKVICTKNTGQRNDYISRFLPREMKIVSQLKHPNILRFYAVKDYRENTELPFVVFTTEWAAGGDLLKKIKKIQAKGAKGLPESDMKLTFRQLTDALHWMDQRNFCHRDLKCENIMLDAAENVRLGDFGFARVLMPNEKSNTFCGSRAYVAPEIVLSQSYNGRPADVWSVGIIMYVSTTGYFPFDESNHDQMIARQLGHKLNFPSKCGASKQLKEIVLCALEPMPDRRPSYAQLMAMDFLKGTPLVQRTTTSAAGGGGGAEPTRNENRG